MPALAAPSSKQDQTVLQITLTRGQDGSIHVLETASVPHGGRSFPLLTGMQSVSVSGGTALLREGRFHVPAGAGIGQVEGTLPPATTGLSLRLPASGVNALFVLTGRGLVMPPVLNPAFAPRADASVDGQTYRVMAARGGTVQINVQKDAKLGVSLAWLWLLPAAAMTLGWLRWRRA